jgi:integrase
MPWVNVDRDDSGHCAARASRHLHAFFLGYKATTIHGAFRPQTVAWLKAAEKDPEERQRRERSTFLCDVDDAGQVFDFHALRHQFITNLARAGVAAQVAQTLARHSTITLTMDRYSHVPFCASAHRWSTRWGRWTPCQPYRMPQPRVRR